MQRSRRWFLRAGALWSSAVVACRGKGDAQAPAEPRALGAAVSPYGARSHFEKTSRYFNQNTKVPLEEASSRTPLHDTYGIITPSSLHFERHHSGVPDIDPGSAHADDSRPGRSAARYSRLPSLKRFPVDLAHPLPRVFGQQRRRMARRFHRLGRAAHPRSHELQRVDRRVARAAAARSAAFVRGDLDARRGRRRAEARAQYPDQEVPGRCAGRLRTERRAAAPRAGLSAAAVPARLGRQRQRQMAAASEGRSISRR